MSLPMGGSHWKCRPRVTPRALRLWLSWTNSLGSPSSAYSAKWSRAVGLHEEAALVLEDLVLDDQDLGQGGATDVHLHGMTPGYGRRWGGRQDRVGGRTALVSACGSDCILGR